MSEREPNHRADRDAVDVELRVDAELRAVRRRILEAGDTARERLARDLHDGAQQKIVGALIKLQLAQQKWSSDPARARELLDVGVQQAEAGLDALRELAAGIHPPILTHYGLAAAVRAMTADLPLPVRLVLTNERFPLPVEASAYFFVSEALTNVVKHAQASEATVSISCSEHVLTVEACDDGVGGARMADDGSGLRGLADRVAALDGQLSLASPADEGTSLRAEIPLPNEVA
jgi:signal transduction histidine kinase